MSANFEAKRTRLLEIDKCYLVMEGIDFPQYTVKLYSENIIESSSSLQPVHLMTMKSSLQTEVDCFHQTSLHSFVGLYHYGQRINVYSKNPEITRATSTCRAKESHLEI